MQVTLSYGRGHLPLDLPDDLQITVLRKKPLPAPILADPQAAVRQALTDPVGAAPLQRTGARRP